MHLIIRNSILERATPVPSDSRAGFLGTNQIFTIKDAVRED